MLFIMRGTSCSGKDVFISQSFPDSNHVISSDVFRELLLGDITSQQHNDRVFGMMLEVLEYRLLNRVEWTVWNSTNMRFKDIHKVIEMCKKYHEPFTFISINPPSFETLRERNEKRKDIIGMDIPDSVFERHLHRYEASKSPFQKEAVYNDLCTWIEIDQDHNVLEHIS